MEEEARNVAMEVGSSTMESAASRRLRIVNAHMQSRPSGMRPECCFILYLMFLTGMQSGQLWGLWATGTVHGVAAFAINQCGWQCRSLYTFFTFCRRTLRSHWAQLKRYKEVRNSVSFLEVSERVSKDKWYTQPHMHRRQDTCFGTFDIYTSSSLLGENSAVRSQFGHFWPSCVWYVSPMCWFYSFIRQRSVLKWRANQPWANFT